MKKMPALSKFCEFCDSDGFDLTRPTGEKDEKGRPLYEPCGYCNGSCYRPTDYGMKLLVFLKEQLPRIFSQLKSE